MSVQATRVFTLVFALGSISSLGVAQSSPDSFETQLAEGIKLLGEGKPLGSVNLLNRVKQLSPQDARPYFYCGIALEQAGRIQDAASELGEAVHLAPDQPVYRVFQAHVLEELKQPFAAEDALALAQKDLKAGQLAPSWLRLMVDVYCRLRNTGGALKVLDLWAARDPNDWRIDLYRGQVYVVKGQPDRALTCFERSARLSANDPQANHDPQGPRASEACFEIGKILYEKNRFPEAKAALLKAVKDEPRNPAYLAKLASVCLALGDPKAGIDFLSPVESSGLALPEIYYVLARAYNLAGDAARHAECMKAFQEATAVERDRQAKTLEAERPIAQAQRQVDAGNPAGARALFEQAFRADPEQWAPNAYLAEMDLGSGDLQQAYAHLEKLEQLDPDSAVGNFLMARYWFKRNDMERARVYAEKVSLSRPGNSELRALLGDIYTKLGQKEKALEEYQEAIQLAPDKPELRDRLRKVESAAAKTAPSFQP
ncbi:MAG TPA: tetratricopeptide repeat protein [Terriglobia bacterium]|nr:tetratricopeptide repeat protein [Terriglobia bacterium]